MRMGFNPWLPVQSCMEAQLVVASATRSDRRLNSGTTGSRGPWSSLQPARADWPFGEYRGGCGLYPNAGRTDVLSVECGVALQPGAGPKVRQRF